jgi:hypothetical protein
MIGGAQILPDAVVVPVTASGELSIAQALLRLLDTISPPEALAQSLAPTGVAQTVPADAAQVPSAG